MTLIVLYAGTLILWLCIDFLAILIDGFFWIVALSGIVADMWHTSIIINYDTMRIVFASSVRFWID